MPETSRPQKSATESANELADLAARNADPGHRLVFLQWADAFRRLASLGADPDLRGFSHKND